MKIIVVCDELIRDMRTLTLFYPISADMLDMDGFSGMFHLHYPNIPRSLREKKNLCVGKIYKFSHRNPMFYSYPFVVKEKSFSKVSVGSYKSALLRFKEILRKERVHSFDIPLLGVSTDNVSWLELKDVLQSVFADLNGVCYVHVHPTLKYLIERYDRRAEIY